jgi:hypothetical protein
VRPQVSALVPVEVLELAVLLVPVVLQALAAVESRAVPRAFPSASDELPALQSAQVVPELWAVR